MDTIQLERNMLMTMPGGWKMSQVDPKQPTTTYGEFKHEILNEITRCLNIEGEIKDGGATEEMATNQLDTYAKKFCLTRKMIINDDLGAFLKVPTSMGNRAARLVDQLFFKRLRPLSCKGRFCYNMNCFLLVVQGRKLRP